MTRRHDESGAVGGHVSDLLSAYIDNQLSPAEHDSVRRHLQTCVDCRGDYIELRATQQMLHSMPPVVPPRAFTLTPEMARQARPAKLGWLARLMSPNNAPRYALGSAMSFVLLALIFVGTLLSGNVTSQAAIGTTSVPMAAQAPDAMRKNPAEQGTASPGAMDNAASAAGAAAAAPTGTTAPAAGIASGGAQAEGATPSQLFEVGPATPVTGVAGAPQPEGTPAPSGDSATTGVTSAQAADTPATALSTGGTGSPATNTYENAPPNASRVVGEGASGGAQVAALPLLEVGLLALGLLFAAGALLARRGA